MTMPSLFSQFVPSISSMSSDDLSRSAIERSIPLAAKLGAGRGSAGVGAGVVGDVAADAAVFCVTQFSAIRTEGLGPGVGSTGGGRAIGESYAGACGAAPSRSDVFVA